MAKKITLKNKAGEVLCPHTAIEQVQGLKEALDDKLGKTEKVSSATEADSAYKLTVMSFRPASANIPTTDGGLYQFKATSNMTEGDPGKDGHIIHSSWDNSEWSSQLFLGADVGMSVDDRMKVRWQESGVWSDWKTVAFTDSTVASVIDGAISTSKIADAAITPAKIQTSIALNGTPSMTVEPTTSSPDKTIASVGLVKEAVADLEIDTRNLIPDSASVYTKVHATSNSFSKQILLPIGTKVGDTFVFNCDGIVNNQGSAAEYSLLLFDMTNMKAASNYLTLTSENRIGYFTITRDVSVGSLYIFLYAGKNGSTAGNAVTYTNCTLVRGDKPMLMWQAAPEDVEAKIEAVKPTIFLQTLQPSATEVKEGDIWIIQ